MVAKQRSSPTAASTSKDPHPSGFEFEFFGPHVPGLLLVVLPAVLYGLILGCNKDACLRLHLTSWPPSVTLPTHGEQQPTANRVGWTFANGGISRKDYLRMHGEQP